MYWAIQNLKESNHVSAISLAKNNWDGIIYVLENIQPQLREKGISRSIIRYPETNFQYA